MQLTLPVPPMYRRTGNRPEPRAHISADWDSVCAATQDMPVPVWVKPRNDARRRQFASLTSRRSYSRIAPQSAATMEQQ